MRKNIQLHIPEPCHEDWNKMTPVEKGRFCVGCQKQVVDFTGMSDEQLVAFFRKRTNNVCGRFFYDQLNRNIEIPGKRIHWVKYFFQLALPALFVTSKGYAQGSVKKLEMNTISNAREKNHRGQFSPKTVLLENYKVIQGLVVDEANGSIPYATVLIKGTASLTFADSTGHFELIYRGEHDQLVLASSRINFKETEVVIDVRKSEQLITIVMHENIQTLEEVIVESKIQGTLGLVIVGGIKSTNISVDEIDLPDTVSIELPPPPTIESVYPNPAKSFSMINIKLGKYDEGEYIVQMISLGGQVLLNKVQWIRDETPSILVRVPAVANGTYLISVINRKSRKFASKKIIIE